MLGPVHLTLFLGFLVLPCWVSSGDPWADSWMEPKSSDWGPKSSDWGEMSSDWGPESSDWGSKSSNGETWPMSPKDKLLSHAAKWMMMMKGGKGMGKPSWDDMMEMMMKKHLQGMKDKWGGDGWGGDGPMWSKEDMWKKLMNMTDMGGGGGVNWDKENDPEKEWKMKMMSKEKVMMDGSAGGNEKWEAMFRAYKMKGKLFWPGFNAKWNMVMKKAKKFMLIGQEELQMEFMKIKQKYKNMSPMEDKMKAMMGSKGGKMYDMMDWMGDKMKDMMGPMGMGDKMKDMMGSKGDKMYDMMDWMGDKKKDMMDPMGDKMMDMMDWMGDKMKDKMDWMGGEMYDMMDPKGDKMKDMMKWMGGKMYDMMDPMGDKMKDMMDPMGDKMKDMMMGDKMKDMMDPMGGMDEEAYMMKLKTISMMLAKAGAKDMYTKEEWMKKVKKMLSSSINEKDPLIDMSAPFTKELHMQFWAPKLNFPLCGMEYTLPEVSQHLRLKGETIMASDTRSWPRFFIMEDGELVKDGWYTIIWVDRGEPNSDDGTPNEPFLQMMVTDIPGSDLSKGQIITPFKFIPFGGKMEIFLFKQSRFISCDIAIAKYANTKKCQARHRCRFRMQEFVKDFDLKLETVGCLKIQPDPASALYGMLDGSLNDKTACNLYLDRILVQAMKEYDVDVKSPEMVKKAWKKYTTVYMPKVHELGEMPMMVLKKQLCALNKTLAGKPLDNLIPPLTKLTHDVAFWFWSPPKTVGPLCGFKFDLPEVDKFSYLKNDILPAALIRDAPRVKITNKMTGKPDEDKLFTIVVAERGFDLPGVGSLDEPFIQWVVTNIQGSNVQCATTVIPYRGSSLGLKLYVFVYQQQGPVHGVAPKKLTSKTCRAPMRCSFQMKRFVEKYNLRLAAVGKFRSIPDVWGAMQDVRMGNESPNEACGTYMTILKAKMEMKKNGVQAGSDEEVKGMIKAIFS